MADVIYFPDGTNEVLIGPNAFENVLLTRLGPDALNWYKEQQDKLVASAEEAEIAESNLYDEIESCREICFEAVDNFDEAIELIENSKRLDKEKLLKILRRGRTALNDNL